MAFLDRMADLSAAWPVMLLLSWDLIVLISPLVHEGL
jgi:hypothetical protein